MARVRLFAHIYCGRTPCDIHGEHDAVIYCEYRAFLGAYNFIMQSECYGRVEEVNLSHVEMIKVMERWAHMPHTRRAIRKYRMAMKIVRDNAMAGRYFRERKPEVDSQVTPPVPVTSGDAQPYVRAGVIHTGNAPWWQASIDRIRNYTFTIGNASEAATAEFDSVISHMAAVSDVATGRMVPIPGTDEFVYHDGGDWGYEGVSDEEESPF
jgi:hypothetical protein